MDPVRKDLYISIFKKAIKRPPRLKVILNYIFYKIEMALQKTHLRCAPFSMVMYINKRCNFDCTFCYNQDVLNTKTVDAADMTFDEFLKIIHSPVGEKVYRMAFMGGEPFMNPEIFKFIEYASNQHKLTNVVTNASVIKGKVLEKLLASKLDVIGISLYDNNIEDVERLVTIFNKEKITYWVQTVASAQDLNEIKERVLFCKKIKCRNLIISNYNPHFDGKDENVIFETNTNYIELERELRQIVQNTINIQWVNKLPVNRLEAKRVCRMPFSYVHVDNTGELGPCCFRYPEKSKYGSIFSKETWNTKSFKQLRRSLTGKDKELIEHCKKCENLSRDLYGV